MHVWTLDGEKMPFSSYGEHVLVRNAQEAEIGGVLLAVMIQMRTDLIETGTESQATKPM